MSAPGQLNLSLGVASCHGQLLGLGEGRRNPGTLWDYAIVTDGTTRYVVQHARHHTVIAIPLKAGERPQFHNGAGVRFNLQDGCRLEPGERAGPLYDTGKRLDINTGQEHDSPTAVPVGKPRMGESAEELWNALLVASRQGVTVDGRGIHYPVLRIYGEPEDFQLASDGTLQVLNHEVAGVRPANQEEVEAVHSALGEDCIHVVVLSRPGYGSDYKVPRTLRELHSPSGNAFRGAITARKEQPFGEVVADTQRYFQTQVRVHPDMGPPWEGIVTTVYRGGRVLEVRRRPDEPLTIRVRGSQIEIIKLVNAEALHPGDVFLTTSGRHTTPFPKHSASQSKAQATKDEKKLRQWLKENAIQEARSRQDRFNLLKWEHLDPNNWSPSDYDLTNLYLFDDEHGRIASRRVDPCSLAGRAARTQKILRA